jgi:hypothetical protein
MSIHQIQISFVPEEDRLLLRFSTRQGEEYRLWLTRRFVRLLWPPLLQAVSAEFAAVTAGSPDARRSLMGLQQKEVLAAANFTDPFRHASPGAPSFPLGEQPLLAHKLVLGSIGPGKTRLHFMPLQGDGVDMVLNRETAHSLLKLLSDACAKTDWGITLALPAFELPGPERPALLN